MLRVCEGIQWNEALMQVLPLRKGAYICNSVKSDSSSSISEM